MSNAKNISKIIPLGTNAQVLTTDGTSLIWADPSAAINKYTANIGNGSDMTFTITHNLASSDIYVSVREVSSGYFVYPDIKYNSANAIAVEFSIVPSSNQYYVSVIGA